MLKVQQATKDQLVSRDRRELTVTKEKRDPRDKRAEWELQDLRDHLEMTELT